VADQNQLRLPTLGVVVRTYGRLMAVQVRSHTPYRASFLMDIAGNAVAQAIDVIYVLALFQVTRRVAGFAATEVLVMFGLSSTAFALADLAVGNIERLGRYIRQGLLDAVLSRPLPVLGQLIAGDFTVRRISRVVISVLILAISLIRAAIVWTPARVLLVVLAPLCGAVFFGAVYVAGATVAFWWIDSGEFASGFTYGGRDFTAYPVNVYSGLFRWVFGYSLGFAFVAYYPGLALLGRVDPLGAPAWMSWCSPLAAIGAAALSGLLWRVGIRRYSSTGS
jgi:ABC-2 type transport system permease protein